MIKTFLVDKTVSQCQPSQHKAPCVQDLPIKPTGYFTVRTVLQDCSAVYCSVVAFESSRGGSEELDVSTFSVVAFTASDVNTTQLSPAQPALQTRAPTGTNTDQSNTVNTAIIFTIHL